MSTVGIERRWDRTARIGSRIGSRIGWRGPLILLGAGLVFAIFFAIGRATRPDSAAHGEGASSLPVASVSATVPARLEIATPIETNLLPPPPPPPPRKAKPFSAPTASARLATATPEASRAAAPAPRVSAPPAPAPAPVHESAPPRPSSGGSSGGSHSGSGSGSGGGTFESSG